jgi:sirohydrochlorin ferrochelatase
MSTAVLLIAHGSRNPEANADLDHVADEIRKRGLYAVVATAYLELAEPTIAQAGASCVAAGAQEVVLLPYFLSAGVHVRDDLRRHRDELARQFPAVRFLLAEPLGRHPLLIEVLLQRADEVSQARKPTDGGPCAG